MSDPEGHAAGPPAVFISSTSSDQAAAYSPSGKRIAFVSARSGSNQIWVCDRDGFNPRQLTSVGEWSGSPRWSPDGNRIAFDVLKGGQRDIYVIDSDGGAPRRVTRDGADVTPSWSADGKWIYFASQPGSKRQIWKTPAGGGEVVQVSRTGSRPRASPDGKFVYNMKPGSLWKAPVAGGPEAEVVTSLGRKSVYALADRGIYFIANLQDTPKDTIQFLSFETGETSTIAITPATSADKLEVSHDGRTILYTQFDQRGGDIMLVENFR